MISPSSPELASLLLDQPTRSISRLIQMTVFCSIASLLATCAGSAQAGVLFGYGYQELSSKPASTSAGLGALDEFVGVSLPVSNVLTVIGSSGSSTDTYSYTQSGGVTTFAWKTEELEGILNSVDQYFTATTDMTYSWTASWDYANSVKPYYFAGLYDLAENTYLFGEEFVLTNQTGSLIAGHQYELYAFHDGAVDSPLVLGDFNLTLTEVSSVSTVPEPASLTVFGIFGTAILFRRRARL